LARVKSGAGSGVAELIGRPLGHLGEEIAAQIGNALDVHAGAGRDPNLASVRGVLSDAAEVVPSPRSPLLVLTEEQRWMLALFAPDLSGAADAH